MRLRERRHRDDEGLFVVEGERLYRRALDAGLKPVLTFVSTDSEIETMGDRLTVAPDALDRASYRSQSQDLIGVFPQLDTRLESLAPPEDPLLLVAEDVEKPGNLGAMLRTAAAAGADAVVVVGESLDAHNPNAVRASTGALFSVPLAVSNWDALQPWLSERNIRLLSSSPAATESLWDTDLTGALALMVGAEDRGLSPRADSVTDRKMLIPQASGSVDSLNVSVAAAILLYEARRQRS